MSATPDDCGYGENVTNCTVEGRGGGFCYAGYECAAGSSTPEGDADCPENSFCEAGPPGNAQDCPPGTYQSEVGQAGCLQCLPGHFCAPLYFTNGSIALEEARLQPCPNGTYNPAAGSVAIDACLTCPSGSVCGNAANTTQPCPAGYYCPEKTTVPTICPNSYYCPASSGEPLPCPSDFYCTDGVSEPTPCDGGTYCPSRSAAETLCPAGKYTQVANLSGNIATDGFPCKTCPGGFYCLEGSTNATICPEGFFCEEGSSFYETCPPGNSCPLGSPAPVPCEAGYYCPVGSEDNGIECPLGTYCPAGSFEPTSCALGYYDNGNHTPRNSSDFVCLACPPGTAGDDANRSMCNICVAGHVCEGATTSVTPTDQPTQNGYECPAGYYCPEGSFEEIPCPAGHYNDEVGGEAFDACVPCPVSFFANKIGSSACRTCGGTSDSPGNATTCQCRGSNRAYQTYTQACTCIPRYEYRAAEYPFTLVSDEDGSANCTAIEYSSCTGFDALDNANFSAYYDTVVAEGSAVLVRNSDGTCVPDDYCPSCGSAGGVILGDGMPCTCNADADAVTVSAGIYCNGVADRGLICDSSWTISEDHDTSVSVVLDNGTALTYTDSTIVFNGRGRCTKPEGCSIFSVTVAQATIVTQLAPVPGDDLYEAAVSLLDNRGVIASTTTTTTTTATSTTTTSELNTTVSVNLTTVAPTTTTTQFVDTCNRKYGSTSCDTFAAQYPNDASMCQTLLNANYDCTGCSLIFCSCELYGTKYETCNGAQHECGTLADGVCDAANNVESCSWDGGDCAGVPNALLCVEAGDAVVFNMPSDAYPVYVRDSLLNTNMDFDYSEFSLLDYNARANEYQV